MSRRYPKFQNFPLQYYHKVRQWDYDVQWGFGAGLHYTTFNYTKLTVTTTVRALSRPGFLDSLGRA